MATPIQNYPSSLLSSLVRLALLQREAVDHLALHEAVTTAEGLPEMTPQAQLANLAKQLKIKTLRLLDAPDVVSLPLLIATPDGYWGIMRGHNARGQWICEWYDTEGKQWQESAHASLSGYCIATVRFSTPYRLDANPVLRLTVDEMLTHKWLLIEASVGGVLIAFLALLTSFYTMQIYDRVVPTGATHTLLVLTLGVIVAIGLEYYAKQARSGLYERLIDQVDQRLARTVYLRFLGIRLDQLPASVGSLASQLRGYDSVRVFLVNLTAHLVVDAPFALIFLLVIASIGGILAFIPLFFFIVALGVGIWQAGHLRKLAERNQAVANSKTGLLVESIEAAEIIKSNQGGWRMLGRWIASSDDARDIDLSMRRINENNQYRAVALQQIAFVLLVAAGAWMTSRGELTTGALVACSILSGRVLNPATQIGLQISAWVNVKVALQGLDAFWKLEDDHHGQEQVIHLDQLRGSYRFEQVSMNLRGRHALKIEKLKIESGQRIGVLGPVGAGKTTFLRLLSGMYKPSEGRIWLADVDLSHLSKPLLAEKLSYLPQEGRLISGTLRDNLLLGILDPGDEVILQAAKTTGLYDSVITCHPKGLQQEIAEGGTGLSGGQRQLVNLTRVFLRQPKIWLLDEPSAFLDRALELQLKNAIQTMLKKDDTLVLVTHKPELLQLVDRLIVIANQQVLIDGPRDAVLARLQGVPRTHQAAHDTSLWEMSKSV